MPISVGHWPIDRLSQRMPAGPEQHSQFEQHGEPPPQLDAARYFSGNRGLCRAQLELPPRIQPVVFRYGAETRRLEGEHSMPGVWLVQAADGTEERIEAGMPTVGGGALVAPSLEGVLTRAWAPGSWQTVRLLSGMEAHPAARGNDSDVVVGLHMA